jgi:hypothetical protein
MREGRNTMSQLQRLNVSTNAATVIGDLKITISLKSGVGDGMVRRCCRRGEDPMTMMILEYNSETMLRR